MKSVFEEILFMKNMGPPWKEGEIRLEVNKVCYETGKNICHEMKTK